MDFEYRPSNTVDYMFDFWEFFRNRQGTKANYNMSLPLIAFCFIFHQQFQHIEHINEVLNA
jgi:hypothetical protein